MTAYFFELAYTHRGNDIWIKKLGDIGILNFEEVMKWQSKQTMFSTLKD